MPVTDETVARAAKALEKRIKQSIYGWSDDQFEIWWNRDPRFIQQEKSWPDAFGRGTEKEHLLWKVRIALEAAQSDENYRALAEVLEALKFAAARVRLANAEGDPILSAWLPGADAAIAKAENCVGSEDPSSATGSEDTVLDALRRAERFISGFEGDPLQDGIADGLDAIRSAIACLEAGMGRSPLRAVGPAAAVNNGLLPAVGTDGEIRAGHYVATATVSSTRRNLFIMEPGKQRHIGTLIAGSRSKIAHFELDCARIVAALAALDPSGYGE